jgi:hypothetical protein
MTDWWQGAEPFDGMTDWDIACGILGDLDYEKQFIAIRALLTRQKRADEAIKREIEELDAFARRTVGPQNERAIDDYGVAFYDSVFQGAAHSMAAVGMLAPFVESLFVRAFQGIRDRPYRIDYEANGHPRWSMKASQRWNCDHSLGRSGPKIVNGIIEMADATGLVSHMPRDLHRTLSAIFEYRNAMFHNGFEWPTDERTKFARKIVEAGWPGDWFRTAESDHKPWIFYMSDEFVAHCMTIVEQVLNGFGAFVRVAKSDIRSLPTIED